MGAVTEVYYLNVALALFNTAMGACFVGASNSSIGLIRVPTSHAHILRYLCVS
jgi:hypothetical protein